MDRRAVIFGIKGKMLTSGEKYILRNKKPWGIILFSRNIENLFQLKFLIQDIRKIVRDINYPILIDQEGGRVSRLNKIVDLSLFTQSYFAKIYAADKKNFFYKYKLYTDTVCHILNSVGININTTPVLDVRRKNSHKIIGDRSFSENPEIVSKLGKICIELHERNKIFTVIKHIPGHGLSKYDSHKTLPIIKSQKSELINKDFMPFKSCKSLFAMTAHVKYFDYDPIYTATHSKKIIKDVIRKKIGFKGILMSDDISMKALKFGLRDNTIKALDAGCNLILHCNGNIKEMKELVKIIPTIDAFTLKKTSQFYKFLG